MSKRSRRIIGAVVAGLLLGGSVAWAAWDLGVLLCDVIRRAPPLTAIAPVRRIAPRRPDASRVLESRLFEPADPVDAGPVDPPVVCDPSLRLVGAFVDAVQTTRSLVLLRVPGGGARIGRVGQALPPWVIERITPSSVLLRGGDRSCALDLFTERVAAPPSAPPVLEPTPPRVEPSLAAIRRLGPNRVEVPRELVLSAVTGGSSLPTTMRLVPTPRGLRVFGMRGNDPLARLGLRNGDVIQAVDGHPPGELDAMLRLAEELPQRDRVTIVVARPGGAERIEILLR